MISESWYLAGLAALAATMKEDALRGYWNKPDEDRDWDVVHITRFLIEVGSTRAVNRVAADAGEAAR